MKILYKALLFLAISSAYGQNSLTGTVNDKTRSGGLTAL